MKIAVIIVRVLLGLMFLFASIVFFFKLPVPQPQMTGAQKTFMEGLMAAVYFMPLLKTTELLCGLAFVTGRFVPLACVMIFPVVLNIFLYDVFLDLKSLPMGIALLLANLFLAFVHRKHYQALLASK